MARRRNYLHYLPGLCMLALARTAFAGAFEVAPTTITLNNSPTGVFFVTNRSDKPIMAQVEAYAWTQTDTGQDRLDDTDALIISPPIVELQPDQQQTIRFMVRPDSGAHAERAFRLLVSEIPDPAAKTGDDNVRMLLQFSVPVFVAGADSGPAKLDWSVPRGGEGLTLTAHNTGPTHAKISGLELQTDAGASVPADGGKFHYILAGSSSLWKLPDDAKAQRTLRLKAYDDIAASAFTLPAITP